MNFKKEIIRMSKLEGSECACDECIMHYAYGLYPDSKIQEELSMYDFDSCLPLYLTVLLSVFSKEKAISIFKKTIDKNVFGFPCEKSKEIFEYIVKEINSKKLNLE